MITFSFSLNSDAASPLYEQLYRHIRVEIENGHLAADEKLPSKRTLCAYLRISQHTVETAYAQLTAEGYLYTKPKSGYYVQKMEPPLHFGEPLRRAPDPPAKNSRLPSPVPLYDFQTNAVDTGSFPFSTWAKLTRETLCEDSRKLLGAMPPQGDRGLREEIARYLYAFRGIETSPEQIVVGAGFEYLLGLVVQLLGRDRIYAIENPGYPKIGKILKSNGAATVAVGLDKSGIRPDLLRRSEAAVVHVTPSHHFPLGIIMPVARRQQLLGWAEESENRYILEDDYDSEFRFSGRPIPALQGMDRQGRVIYFNTFAKSLAPSFRIGYMVLPPALLAQYRKNFAFYSTTVPSFEQFTLCRFLRDGFFERHLSRMRNRYRARRDSLLDALRERDPAHKITVSGQDTGVHLLLAVNNGMSEPQLVEKALASGVKVYGLSRYYAQPASAPSGRVVLGYAGFSEEAFDPAAERLASAWGL